MNHELTLKDKDDFLQPISFNFLQLKVKVDAFYLIFLERVNLTVDS